MRFKTGLLTENVSLHSPDLSKIGKGLAIIKSGIRMPDFCIKCGIPLSLR